MYQALYRVWRPQTFQDVVGQEVVVKTLRNAVKEKRISHAYLFTGTRGTGKTSLAKIFAKAINCPNCIEGNPCNQCDICQNITKGALSDIIEIDAASNNGVDEIREIRDKSRYAATITDYKVYIIDEVHMLSIGAFNALLKTLEEPSENVVFILATTEPHKIPQTIMSRVQRYDFKRIPDNQILERLKFILNSEHIQFDEQALQIIVRYAEGGMRDALSLLDQVLAVTHHQMTLDSVLDITGAVTQEVLVQYLQYVIAKDTDNALQIVNDLLAKGKSVTRIVEELIFTIRDILVSPYVHPKEKSVIENFDVNRLYGLLQELSLLQQQLKVSMQQEVYLEVFTVKQCVSINLLDSDLVGLQQEIDTLKLELEQLKQQKIVFAPVVVKKEAPVKTKKYQVNLTKIFNVLHQATAHDKHEFEANYADILERLHLAQRAKITNTSVLAVSQTAVLLGFEYDAMCQITVEDTSLQEAFRKATYQLLSHDKVIECIPLSQWQEVRSQYLLARKENTLGQYGIGTVQSDVQFEQKGLSNEQEVHQINQEETFNFDMSEKVDVVDNLIQKATELFGNIVEIKE